VIKFLLSFVLLAGPATVRMPVPMQVSTGPVVVEENGSFRPYYLPGVPAQMMQIPPGPYVSYQRLLSP
jgi:hypothetical protein